MKNRPNLKVQLGGIKHSCKSFAKAIIVICFFVFVSFVFGKKVSTVSTCSKADVILCLEMVWAECLMSQFTGPRIRTTFTFWNIATSAWAPGGYEMSGGYFAAELSSNGNIRVASACPCSCLSVRG